MLGPDVDAPGRVEAEHRPDATGDPARDRHFLLVAARQPADLALGPRVDLQSLDGADNPAPLFSAVDDAPAAQSGQERQGDVLADRSLHEKRLGPVGGDVDDPLADRVGRVAERDRDAVDEQLPAARARGAGEGVEELVLALPLEGDDAQNLARVEVEREILEPCAGAQAARGQAGLGARPSRGRGSVGRGNRLIVGELAEHQFDDPFLSAGVDVDDPDRLALPQDRRPIAYCGDLDEAMGDEDDRAVGPPVAGDDLEDPLGQVGRESRRHLVHEQHVGLDRECSREVDDPERRQRHVPGEA